MLTFLKLVISTFVLIGHRSRAVAWGLSQGRRSPLCNHRHNSDFPNVTMSVPSNSTEVWFGNDTFRILQNMDLGINLTCESRYPIQWVETYDKVSRIRLSPFCCIFRHEDVLITDYFEQYNC